MIPTEPNPEHQAVNAYPEHDCYLWNHQHYLSSPEYLARECGLCGKITGFRWRKVWRRIVSLWSCDLPKTTSDDGRIQRRIGEGLTR